MFLKNSQVDISVIGGMIQIVILTKIGDVESFKDSPITPEAAIGDLAIRSADRSLDMHLFEQVKDTVDITKPHTVDLGEETGLNESKDKSSAKPEKAYDSDKDGNWPKYPPVPSKSSAADITEIVEGPPDGDNPVIEEKTDDVGDKKTVPEDNSDEH